MREGKMGKLTAVILIVFVLFVRKANCQVEEPLNLIQTITLPGLHDGDFDHFASDLQGQRLFLAAEENSAVEVVDLRTHKVLQTLKDIKTPHLMAYDTDSKKLFVVNEGPPNEVDIFDGTSFKLLGTMPMDAHADASIYDMANHLLYVGNGGRLAHEDYCMLSVINTVSGEKVADIKLDADQIEAMALEKSGPRLFINLRSKNAVAVVDREKRAVIATWSNAQEGRANGPMAFDEVNHRLFVISRDPNKVIVMDSNSGKIVATAPCIGQYISDDAVYDPGSKRLYVAGTPFIEVFAQRGADSYQLLGQLPSAYHADTAILIPQLNRYYVAVNHHGNVDAKIQVYEVLQ